MSDLHRQIVIETFGIEDDAIRAIQGLKAAGFDSDDMTIAGRDDAAARHVAEITGVSLTDEWPDAVREQTPPDCFRLVVKAGENAALAHQVIADGIVDATGLGAQPHDNVYLDSSTGSGAGVAASTGTAIGISPGAGYEGNTGSTAGSSAGALGQFAPRADTPDDDDDFPG